jgi:hypothetical protein
MMHTLTVTAYEYITRNTITQSAPQGPDGYSNGQEIL